MLPDDPSSVTITLRDIYDMVSSQGYALLEIKSDIRNTLERGEDHEKRLRVVEASYVTRGAMVTALSIALAVFGAVMTIVTLLIG